MASSKTKELAKSKGRSRLSNGHALPRSVDSRTIWARRFRDLLALHLADLGGPNVVSAGEAAIVRKACALICATEEMEETFALNGKADPGALETYQRCANTMRRLLESVGLQRRSKDVTPTLDEYLASRSQASEAAE